MLKIIINFKPRLKEVERLKGSGQSACIAVLLCSSFLLGKSVENKSCRPSLVVTQLVSFYCLSSCYFFAS